MINCARRAGRKGIGLANRPRNLPSAGSLEGAEARSLRLRLCQRYIKYARDHNTSAGAETARVVASKGNNVRLLEIGADDPIIHRTAAVINVNAKKPVRVIEDAHRH